MEILNFIDGEFVPSASADFFTQSRPFSDRSDVRVANSGPLDLVKALQGAHKAQTEWKESTLSNRADIVDKIIQYLQTHKHKFAELESWDQGLNLEFSQQANIEIALKKLTLLKVELNSSVAAAEAALPVGVIGVILSWNLSTRLFVEKVIPAILAGNAVIVKVSSQAPATALLWGELFQSIQFPKGLIQILHSNDIAFKKLMITHPGIKALIFTGSLESSVDVLKNVAHISAQQFKKIQIHSGSKNTAVVIGDLDETQMQDVFHSFMRGQGQLAWNSARLFILEKNEKNWTDFITQQMHDLKPSQSILDNSVWTPLVKNKYVENFLSIENQARTDQAKIITVKHKLQQGSFVSPFFTKDMSNCSTLQQDQVLGPAFVLSTVKYAFDIPKYSNVSYFGHSASVWTELGKNQKTIHQLDVGHISLNQWSLFHAQTITGVKQSAFGTLDCNIFGAFYSNVKNIT